jgi:diaminopimelate epimerase
VAEPLAFSKYHALGNDYLVIDPTKSPFAPSAEGIQALCDRHRGVGSDGVLLGPLPVPADPEAFGLRIFNPDGSEAEKSGNGLRIFASYLRNAGHVRRPQCRIHTTSGISEIRFLEPDGSRVEVDMGQPSFLARDLPFTGIAPHLEVLQVLLTLPEARIPISAVSVGNPHCVLFPNSINPAEACRLGTQIERHPDFPNRVNVQFTEVIDREHIRIEIWERGAGYTLASGSSSCAAAAVCRRLGLVGDQVKVLMPGGTIDLTFTDQGRILMSGPVQAVCHGHLDAGWMP